MPPLPLSCLGALTHRSRLPGPWRSRLLRGLAGLVSQNPSPSRKIHGGPELVLGAPVALQLSPLFPQKYNELKGNGPFTVFVPHTDLMTNLSRVTAPRGKAGGLGAAWRRRHRTPLHRRFLLQDELARIGAHRQLVFRYHVVGCRQLRSPDLLEEGYVTALSGHPLRFSEREVSQAPPQQERTQTQDSPAFELPPLRACACPHAFKTLSLPLSSALDPAHHHGPVPGAQYFLAPCGSPLPGPPAPPAVSLRGETPFLLDPAHLLQDLPNQGSVPASGPTHSS